MIGPIWSCHVFAPCVSPSHIIPPTLCSPLSLPLYLIFFYSLWILLVTSASFSASTFLFIDPANQGYITVLVLIWTCNTTEIEQLTFLLKDTVEMSLFVQKPFPLSEWSNREAQVFHQ